MNKKAILNAGILYAVIYTITTIVSSILYLASGVYEDPSGNWHEIDRGIIVLIGVLAFTLIKNLKMKNGLIKMVAVYIPTMLLTFLYVYFVSFRGPLAENAYFDIWRSFTSIFIIVAIVSTIINKVRKKNRV